MNDASHEVIKSCTNDADKIVLALMNENDPVGRVMYLYDEAKDKRKFAVAMSAVLLMRTRQWQAAYDHANR